MDQFSSVLAEGRIRFGKYPTDPEVALLKANQYLIFLDLCPPSEITWTPYDRSGLYYNHLPMPDRSVRADDAVRSFLHQLVEVLKQGHRVYIHCRGGHGRSAAVAAVVYGLLTNQDGRVALEAVRRAHQVRGEMKPKYRKLGAPQTIEQMNFVFRELQTPVVYFYEDMFSNFHPAPITVDGFRYPTSEHYFQASKFIYPGASPDHLEYARLIATQSTPNKAKILANQKIKGGYKWQQDLNEIIRHYAHVQINPNWDRIRDDVMSRAVLAKFTQHPNLAAELKRTGSALLVEHTSRDSYWGDGGDGSGQNRLGQILIWVRAQI